MNKEIFQIEPELFYKVGMYCFIIIGIMNFLNYFYFLRVQTIFSSISSFTGIIFNFALAGFFYYLLKQSSPEISTEYASDNIKEILEQIGANNNQK